MNNTEVLELMRNLFLNKLDFKTGWGRKELIKEYNDCEREVLKVLAEGKES